MTNRYQPSYSIEFTPYVDWRKFATGKVRGYRWWVIGPLSFHVMWSAAPEPLGVDNPDMTKFWNSFYVGVFGGFVAVLYALTSIFE